jgi:hypothetical protein
VTLVTHYHTLNWTNVHVAFHPTVVDIGVSIAAGSLIWWRNSWNNDSGNMMLETVKFTGSGDAGTSCTCPETAAWLPKRLIGAFLPVSTFSWPESLLPFAVETDGLNSGRSVAVVAGKDAFLANGEIWNFWSIWFRWGTPAAEWIRGE